ncbi:hypothetical protein TNCV_427361 [Trichonephila clavipes]|nr:hypothetical protein TNCV_427361 [Trichonephila clavipes]
MTFQKTCLRTFLNMNRVPTPFYFTHITTSRVLLPPNQYGGYDPRLVTEWDCPEVINSIDVVKISNPTDISLVWVPF